MAKSGIRATWHDRPRISLRSCGLRISATHFGETNPRCGNAAAVHLGGRAAGVGSLRACFFSCYLQGRVVLAMECSLRQCRVAMELRATNCRGYTLRPTDQRNETA